MKKILFVCTGNTCRSPLAEYLLKHKGNGQFDVQSAGVAAYDGGQASPHVEELLLEKGIKQNHRSQSVSKDLMEWADLVLTMTQGHKQTLQQHYPASLDKLFTLKEYVTPEVFPGDIMDPYGGSIEIYRETMSELEELIELFIKKENEN